MTLRVLFPAALVAGLLPGLASAQPSPVTSIVPPTIRVVPATPGILDPTATFTVTVNDAFGVALPAEPVYLDFSPTPYVKPSDVQAFMGQEVTCGPDVVLAYTNSIGVATFNLRGAIVSRTTVAGPPGILVSAGDPPVPLGIIQPSAYDQDGVNGLNGNDLSLLLCDILNPDPATDPRSDLDGSGTLGAGDLAQWLQQYDLVRDRETTASRCDGMPTTTPLTTPARGSIFLRWNTCRGEGGAQTRTSTCLTNAGSSQLVVSFVAPVGIDAMTGFEVELQVMGAAGVALPPWWNLQPGGCRSTSANPSGVAMFLEGCPDANGDDWGVTARVVEYPTVAGAIDRMLLRVVGARLPPGVALTAGTEYRLFSLAINNARTVGAGFCAGCATPVAVLLNRVVINQPATAAGGCASPALASGAASGARPTSPQVFTGDFQLLPDMSDDEFVAYWQGVPAGFAVTGVPRPGSGARLAIESPNPSAGPMHVALTLPTPSRCQLALYDVAGRQRRVVHSGPLAAGTHRLAWDGRDDRGAPLENGYYVWRATADGRMVTRPQILLR